MAMLIKRIHQNIENAETIYDYSYVQNLLISKFFMILFTHLISSEGKVYTLAI